MFFCVGKIPERPSGCRYKQGFIFLLRQLGKIVNAESLQQLKFNESNAQGEVVVIDHYGNIVTTITKPKPQQRKAAYKVECGSFTNNLNYHETFEEADEGELFVIAGSKSTLELAVRNGSAAAIVKAKVGNRVKIT